MKTLDAGTSFNMIISSVAAYRGDKDIDNFYSSWNRNSLSSSIFCASYIRNDMLGRANCPLFYYGFNTLNPESLVFSDSADLFSESMKFVPTAHNKHSFYTPDTQIGNSGRKMIEQGHKISIYNEMDYDRISDGMKQQPDYIVVFGSYGRLSPNQSGKYDSKFDIADAHSAPSEKCKKIRQCVRDFRKATGKDLPIVYVDLNKVYRNEEKAIDDLIQEYRKNPTSENARKAVKRIKNNGSYKDYVYGEDFLREFSDDELLSFDSITEQPITESLQDLSVQLETFDSEHYKREQEQYRQDRNNRIKKDLKSTKRISLKKDLPIVAKKDLEYRSGNNPLKMIKEILRDKLKIVEKDR